MHLNTTKIEETKNQSSANSLPKRQGKDESGVRNDESQSETVAKRDLSDAINPNLVHIQLSAYQEMANQSSQVKQLNVYQTMADKNKSKSETQSGSATVQRMITLQRNPDVIQKKDPPDSVNEGDHDSRDDVFEEDLDGDEQQNGNAGAGTPLPADNHDGNDQSVADDDSGDEDDGVYIEDVSDDEKQLQEGDARPFSAKTKSGQRRRDLEKARGTKDEVFYEWLLTKFRGDVRAVDNALLALAKKEGQEALVKEGGYLKLSDGDKMHVFYNLGRLEMKGSGATIQTQTFMEYFFTDFNWKAFAIEVRKLGGFTALKETSEKLGTEFNGLAEIQALPDKSAFSKGIDFLCKQLSSEKLQEAIKAQTVGTDDSYVSTFQAIASNVTRLASISVKLVGDAAIESSGLTYLVPGLTILVQSVNVVTNIEKVKFLNERIDTLHELAKNAEKIPNEIYSRAIQKTTLTRNEAAASVAGAATVLAVSATALAILGPATLGVSFGIAALALAIGGLIKLWAYFKNKSDKKESARALLAKIYGKPAEDITEDNEGEYLMKIGYPKGEILGFWEEYVNCYSEDLLSKADRGDVELKRFILTTLIGSYETSEIEKKGEGEITELWKSHRDKISVEKIKDFFN